MLVLSLKYKRFGFCLGVESSDSPFCSPFLGEMLNPFALVYKIIIVNKYFPLDAKFLFLLPLLFILNVEIKIIH